MEWKVVEAATLDASLITALFENEIGAVSIHGFVSAEELDVARAEVMAYVKARADEHEGVFPTSIVAGITQYNHSHSPAEKDAYFERVPESTSRRQQLFPHSPLIINRVLGAVDRAWDKGASIAVEGGNGGVEERAEQKQQIYNAGVIRVIKGAALHSDWSQPHAQGWKVGEVVSQLSWSIYLQVSEGGGATVIYRRPWQEADEMLKAPGAYSYQRSLVEGHPSVRLLPKEGELVLYNARNFHEVEDPEGSTQLITISSFIGLWPASGQLLFWS